jgi:DnaJ family protein A protein 2
MKKTISLVEALVGFEFKVKHLDGSTFNVYTGKGEVLGDREKKVVRGLGMPFFKDPMSSGNLIIEFKLEMPKRGDLSPEQLKELAQLLPGKVNERPKGEYEMLEDFDKEGVNTSEEGGHKNIEEEEEEAEAGGCRAQ